MIFCNILRTRLSSKVVISLELDFKKIAKLSHSGQPLIPENAIGFRFSFQLPKLENHLGDGIVIIPIVGYL